MIAQFAVTADGCNLFAIEMIAKPLGKINRAMLSTRATYGDCQVGAAV